MNAKLRFSILLGTVLIFALTLAIPGSFSLATAKPLEPIKLGFIEELSGMVASFTADDLEGFKAKIAMVNDKGGVKTKDGLRKIELIVRDTMLKPDIAVRCTKELVLKHGAKILYGPMASSSLLAVSEWARKNPGKVIIWGCARSHHATQDKGHRYIFRSDGNTWMNGHAIALYFKDKPYTKWGLINQDYSYGRSNVEAFLHGMKMWKPEAEVVVEQWPKLGTTDYTPYITALMAAKPEIIFSSLWGTDAMTFVKQAKGYGLFNKVKIIGLWWGGNQFLDPMGQEMPEGVYCLTECPFTYPGSPENKAFYDAYKNRTGRWPTAYSMLGWNAATGIIKGIEKAGSYDVEAFADAAPGMIIDTIAPAKKIWIRPCDHQGDYGMVIGITKKAPEWPWLILTDQTVIPGKPTMKPCEEIMKERKKAKR